MISWLKRHLIPHAGNDHRPHLLHGDVTRALVATLFVLEVGVFLSLTLNFANNLSFLGAVLPAVLSDLTNVERSKESMTILTSNPVLDRSASLKAEDMASKGYFAHTSPDGKAPWYWLDQVGYEYQYAGENLAVDFVDSSDVTRAWMNSPTHRANIERAQYTEVGTGVARGVFQGRETTFVAQVYARPAKKLVSPITKTLPVVNTAVVAVSTAGIESSNPEVLGTSTPAEEIATTSAPSSVTIALAVTPTFFQKLLASPRHTANFFLFGIGGLVALVLAVTIAVRVGRQHPDLIMNGLIILVVVFGLYTANSFASHVGLKTSTSFSGFDADHREISN
jgi:hypothetical protein